jgi:hypothetical protein
MPIETTFEYLYADILHVFLTNRRLNTQNKGFKLMILLEEYYQKRYSNFCQQIYREMDIYKSSYNRERHSNLLKRNAF